MTMLDSDEFWSVAHLGYMLFENARYSEAMAIFEGLTVTHGHEPYPWEVLGEIAIAEGQTERAVELLNHAVGCGAGPRAAIQCGHQLMRLGRWSDAYTVLRGPAQGEGTLSKRARALRNLCRDRQVSAGSQ